MNKDIIITILSISLPLIGGFIGFFLKHFIERKKELLNQVNNERRVHYQKFVDLMIDLFAGAKVGKQTDNQKLLTELYDFYKKYILYASPEVINSLANFFQYLYSENSGMTNYRGQFERLSKVLMEMRKDLGLSNKALGNNGEKMFRALLTDFDKIMK